MGIYRPAAGAELRTLAGVTNHHEPPKISGLRLATKSLVRESDFQHPLVSLKRRPYLSIRVPALVSILYVPDTTRWRYGDMADRTISSIDEKLY